MTQRDDLIVWLDLEMTGLDPESCAIVQIGMQLTDPNLDPVGPAWETTIWQPPSVLDQMSPFVRTMHERSGLLEKIRESTIDLADAEREALQILTAHCTFRTARLAGNSIWQDRRFLCRYMPTFERYLHYRQIDVTSIKELAKSWYGVQYDKPDSGQHTALFDAQQSIEELRFLRSKVMR